MCETAEIKVRSFASSAILAAPGSDSGVLRIGYPFNFLSTSQVEKKKKKKEKKGSQNREGGTRFGDVVQYSAGQHLSTSIRATHHPGSHRGLFLHTHSPSFLQKNKNLAPKVKRNDTHFCSFFCSSFSPRVLFVFRAPLLDRAGQSENLRFA